MAPTRLPEPQWTSTGAVVWLMAARKCMAVVASRPLCCAANGNANEGHAQFFHCRRLIVTPRLLPAAGD